MQFWKHEPNPHTWANKLYNATHLRLLRLGRELLASVFKDDFMQVNILCIQ